MLDEGQPATTQVAGGFRQTLSHLGTTHSFVFPIAGCPGGKTYAPRPLNTPMLKEKMLQKEETEEEARQPLTLAEQATVQANLGEEL